MSTASSIIVTYFTISHVLYPGIIYDALTFALVHNISCNKYDSSNNHVCLETIYLELELNNLAVGNTSQGIHIVQ